MFCFSLDPFCQDIPTQQQIKLQMKATRKLAFQVRIYLKRDAAKRSDHEQNQTRPHSKVKLFQHGSPLSRAVERDITAL